MDSPVIGASTMEAVMEFLKEPQVDLDDAKTA
jgi:hypothetical protein